MAAEPSLNLTAAVTAFLQTRWRAIRLRSRADLEAHQLRMIRRWLERDVPKIRYYRSRPYRILSDLPMVDKSVHMSDFAAFNRLELSAEAGWAHFHAGTSPCGYHVGASTGTSGNRGLYLISAAERARWLGTILAKTLPRFPVERARVAIILPQNAALYGQPGRGALLALRFFDLKEGHEHLPAGLAAFRPDTVVAPPKILRFLAEAGALSGLKRIFSGAEVLDPVDRQIIEAASGLRLGEIYMATEGLLATTCPHGRLHLAEDVMHVELEPGPEGSGLVRPVISDFSRSTQIMARYRMNDLLRLSTATCGCGSPLRAVEAIVGRQDDVLLIKAATGFSPIMITPDVVRNTILNAAPGLTDFRCRQPHPGRLDVLLPPGSGPAAARAIQAALSGLIESRKGEAQIETREEHLSISATKLRRVERSFRRG